MNPQAMKPASLSASLLGRTIRWTFSDGPVKGQTFEHTFNDDGSVVWRSIGGKTSTTLNRESVGAVAPVNDQVTLVSYLASNGFTLTVALNFVDMQMVGFASNGQTWAMQRGSFEVLPGPA
jgi:hypothetical protein